jgi:hypothetical protein
LCAFLTTLQHIWPSMMNISWQLIKTS